LEPTVHLSRGITSSANARRSGGACERRPRLLQHIQSALNDIASYCGRDREGFFNDPMRHDATPRKLDVIGQAVKNLSERVAVAALLKGIPRRGDY
jgi:hypothetical protein